MRLINSINGINIQKDKKIKTGVSNVTVDFLVFVF